MEPSNEDAIAAKREARRRRILENSKDRLSKITGREHDDPRPAGKKGNLFRFKFQPNQYQYLFIFCLHKQCLKLNLKNV